MKRQILIIIAFGIVFFLLGNWIMSITSVDEGRNLDAALKMLETGNYIVPYYNCQERFEKPPMLYYVTAMSFKVFGVNEFSARLPSGLAAIGVAIMTYLFALEFLDRHRALYASIVYTLLIHNWIEARAAVPEMLLTFFMCLALWLLVKRRYTLGWIAIALAFLTKGPVGVVLPVGVYLLWRKDLKAFQLKGIVLFIIIGGSWYALMIAKYGYQYFYKFFIYENIMRYTGQRRTHPFPLYYYPMVIGASYVLFLPRLYWIVKNWQSNLRALLWWFLFVLVFFSLAKNRLHHYILFLYPPLAIITASSLSRKYLKVTAAIAILVLSVMLYMSFQYEQERFVPRAVQFLREHDVKRLFFYRYDDAAVVFYTRRCIETIKDKKSLKSGDVVMTKAKYLKEFPEATVLVKGLRQFNKHWVMLYLK